MTSKDFVKCIHSEQKKMLEEYFLGQSETEVARVISDMNLSNEQLALLKNVLKSAFRDLCYTLLLGIDGEAQISGIQHTYRLLDEENNELTGGDLEGPAWEYFHGHEPS